MDNELMPKQEMPSDPLATARWADPFYVADKYRYESGAIWLGRNPHDPKQAIGYRDDRHVFICAETRSGKGRALLVNNQLLWPGSLITIGPKGEEATIAAPRRGQGNEYCEGMGQEVYVLDPMRCAEVPDEYRAHFNPLSALDPEDGELVAKVDRIANAICTIPDAGESAEWAKEGKSYVANAILHVVTFKFIKDEERDLLKVRDLVMQGNVEGAKLLRQHLADQGQDEEASQVDPYMVLLKDMEKNPACHGAISRNARDMMQSARRHIKYFESVRKSASSHLRFLEGRGIMNTVARPKEGALYPRTFDVQDLKNKTISLFICLPEQDYDPLARWLRAMIVIILDAMREKQGLPANGHQILFCIDEFANLGKMDDVGKAINSIAGAGVKLMIAVQRLGDLQELYGKAWEKFIAGAGAQIWFGIEEVATGEYLEKKLGKTEIIKYARSIGKNRSDASAEGTNANWSETENFSTSHTQSSNYSQAISRAEANSLSQSETRGIGGSAGRSKGSSAGRNYGPHLFFEGLYSSTSYGSNSGRNSQRSWNRSKTGGRSKTTTNTQSATHGTGTSETQQSGGGKTQGGGTSHTETHTDGESATITESFHTKPLLSLSEAKQYLISRSDLEHNSFPGMALVTLADEVHPFFVRKANHDQDKQFERLFHPNPAYPYISLDKQPLLGWQITPDHFYTLQIPESLQDVPLNIESRSDLSEGDRLEKGEVLLNIKNPDSSLPEVRYKAPFDLKIIDLYSQDDWLESGTLMAFRSDKAIYSPTRNKLDEYFWNGWVEDHENRVKKEQRRKREKEELEEKLRSAENEFKTLTGERDLIKHYISGKYGWVHKLFKYMAGGLVIFVLMLVVEFSVLVANETNNDWVGGFAALGALVLAVFALDKTEIVGKIVNYAETLVTSLEKERWNRSLAICKILNKLERTQEALKAELVLCND